ncbi:phosphoenolpyruvate carboxykinase [Thermoanaerobacterium aotearoense SCUT27]|uniref:Phosphoenolpyruvate carboxykinase (ATP) n=4 Tax=Thermoanaerobacterium TaxID=28895 RepID=W9E8K6_9THEO|nr:Phosphoenolpyruvate carboxykinase (ATP) [Thermoanaerobacterium saccharolyticum JW/SL-YS485]ETO38137.1 phosphoenolpyruvate carboxykinase [Thermoanaerobacterium aotearoense SCUT27]
MIMKKSKKCFNLNIDDKETLNTFGSSRGELFMIDLDDVFKNSGSILYNLPVSDLIEEAIRNNEGKLLENGALDVFTGKYTGRIPKDKYIVNEESIHNDIWWENNNSMEKENFIRVLNRVIDYLKKSRKLYVFKGFVGADPRYRYQVTVINEYAYQNAFVHQLFINPKNEEELKKESDFTVICVPNFLADPIYDGTNSEAFIIISFEEKLILIGGTRYSGEIKKSVFTMMNYLMLKRNVLPMHCAANIGSNNDTALFFGLSGTGKTTLSTDPERFLIGDDEHGWSSHGIFNFEGGCYAKCINLSPYNEPEIWNAIRFGTILENVIYDVNNMPVYTSSKITENTRASYPLEYIPRKASNGIGGNPKIIFFLAADAFGVLPPISKLTNEQAVDYFLLGYTSKIPGTEKGICEPQATFSSCFGAPFLPSYPMRYAELLKKKIAENDSVVYLINTGWIGGHYGIGKRIDLKYTREIIKNVLNGELEKAKFKKDTVFDLMIPEKCNNIPDELLDPIKTWEDKNDYFQTANNLLSAFKARLDYIKNGIHQ